MKSKFIVTPEIRDEAIRIAINGGDPRNYLTGMGSQNGMSAWTKIRMELKKTNPETFAKLPKRIGKAEVPAAPETPTVKVDGPLRIETPETNQITVAEVPEIKTGDKVVVTGVKAFKVTAIDTEYGEFYHDKKYDCIDWRDLEGDEVSMKIGMWKKLAAELPEILAALGVDA